MIIWFKVTGWCGVALSLLLLMGCPGALERGKQESSRCQAAEIAVQVLGSGGPIPDDDRASSGYLIWIQGKARALIDLGGGVVLRFGQAGAKIEDLDVVALTHLHADHAGDLPSFLKAGYFAIRDETLPILGPDGGERFPATDIYLQSLIDPKDGSFRYLTGYLNGDDGYFKITTRVLPAASTTPQQAFANDRLTIDAVGVHHGDIPSVGYLVTVGAFKIAFTGDQSAQSTAFVTMAKGADLLIAHHASPELNTGIHNLHRSPSQLGDLAAEANAKHMVLSHNMQRTLQKLDQSFQLIKEKYSGKLDVADDLSCYVLK